MMVRKIVLSFVAGALTVLVGLYLLQFSRTCYGKECLQPYQTSKNEYRFPGLFCFQVSEFYFPSKYEKYPELARNYFLAEYTVVGRPRLIIYIAERDRYIVLAGRDFEQSSLRDAEFCRENVNTTL